MATYDVFISYRRRGGKECADHLHEQLSKFGLSVFLDKEELHFGDFRKQLILNNLRSRCLVVVLSPGALDRCCNKGDWVKREISLFLTLGKRIILVCMDGFTFPENLPKSLQRLKKMPQIRYDRARPEQAIQTVGALLTKGWNKADFDYIWQQRYHYKDQTDDELGCFVSAEESFQMKYREDTGNECLNHGFGVVFMLLFLMAVGSFQQKYHAIASLIMGAYHLCSWFCREDEVASIIFRVSFWKGLWALVKKILLSVVIGAGFVLLMNLLGTYLPDEWMLVHSALVVLMCVFSTACGFYAVYQALIRRCHWLNARLSRYFTSCVRRKRRLMVWEEAETIAAIVSVVLAMGTEWLLSQYVSFQWPM